MRCFFSATERKSELANYRRSGIAVTLMALANLHCELSKRWLYDLWRDPYQSLLGPHRRSLCPGRLRRPWLRAAWGPQDFRHERVRGLHRHP